ncbi:MAG: TonB-dependent receptor [Deltaproteobacteria bacterium]|nr:TonB-dependent receptor [Deltaproteobacteria bacterium]
MRIQRTDRRSLALIFALLCSALNANSAAAQVREQLKKSVAIPKLTKPPKLLSFVQAEYPQQALAAKLQGKVELLIELDKTGAVVKVEVAQAPSEALGRSATAAAKKFRFSAAEFDGKPAPIRVRYVYNFVIDERFVPRLPRWLDTQTTVRAEDAIVGSVREQGARIPIGGAAIAVIEAGIEVRADGSGRFAVPDLPAGRYSVRALSPKHKSKTVQVEVKEGEQTQIKFYLKPLTENPYRIVVRGKRKQTSVTRVSLRRKQLTSVPGTFGDPVRVVENLPGLARVPYVGGALLVRGTAPGDSGVFLDGIRIPLIYHFLGGPSVLNAQFLDRIDYFPGNADVRYGRLIAGVVDVATRDTFTEQWHGAVDINLLNAGVFLNAPISKKVSVAAAVRRSYIDAILPSVLKAAGQSATTVVPVYYDYQLRVDARLGGDDRLRVLFFGSDDDLRIASNESDNDFAINLNSKITFHRVLARWDAQFTSALRSKLQPYVGFNLVNFSAGDANVDIVSWIAGLRHDLTLRVSPRLTLRFGLDAEVSRSGFNAEIPLPAPYRNPAGPIDFSPNSSGNNATGDTEPVDISQWLGGIGGYLDAQWALSERLSLVPGVRLGLIMYFGHTRPVVDPRLMLRYKLREATTLKAGAGMYSQAPPPNQANDVAGNPDLVLEHAAHFSVGLEQKLAEALNLDAQFYYIARWDQAIRSDDFDFASGRRRFFSNDGDGYSFGMELLLKHEVTKRFYGWLSYTLSRSVLRRESGGDLVRFVFDQTHLLTLVGSYRLGGGWELGLRFRLTSGRPDTPITAGFFDNDSGRYGPIFGEERSVDRPLFHQLDLRVEKTWFFDLWRLAIYLDVQNVYNAKNPEALLYDYRFRESGPLRGLPFLPTFGIKGAF